MTFAVWVVVVALILWAIARWFRPRPRPLPPGYTMRLRRIGLWHWEVTPPKDHPDEIGTVIGAAALTRSGAIRAARRAIRWDAALNAAPEEVEP